MPFHYPKYEPDPAPDPDLDELAWERSILAAIGEKSTRTLKLRVGRPNFDLTRRFEGHTYTNMAWLRKIPNWKEEVSILVEAYHRYEHAGENRGDDNDTAAKLEPGLGDGSETTPKRQTEESTKSEPSEEHA